VKVQRYPRGRYLCVLAAVYLVLASAYSVIVPAYESPDEVGHFAYVTHLLGTGSLPVQAVGNLGEAHQPPLYYAIAALAAAPADLKNQTGAFRANPEFVWAGRGGLDENVSLHGSAETFPFRGHALALHLARLSSVLMGTVTVVFTVLIGWRVFPAVPVIGLLAGVLTAFNPQFLFISGVVNNDNLLVMVSTISWWQILRVVEQPARLRQWAVAGLLTGLAFLSKVNGSVATGLVALIALVICAFRRRSWRLFFTGAGTVAAAVLGVAGWWWLRNQLLYGDPFGMATYREIFAVNLRYGPLRLHDLRQFFCAQFESFWGVFGWMNVRAPDWYYWAFGAFCSLGTIGLAVCALRRRAGEPVSILEARLPVILLGVAFLAQEIIIVAVITQCNESCYQGRYLFPAIAPLAILLSWGISGWFPQRYPVTLWVVAALLLTAAIVVPLGVIAPAYDSVPLPKWRLWLVRDRADVDFGDMMGLRGYAVREQGDGSEAVLTLYWQRLDVPDFNYSVFVHSIDAADQLIGQQDLVPGDSQKYPPIAWMPGDIVAGSHVVSIPGDLPPGTYRFRVGVYNWATGEQLPITSPDGFADDYVILERVLKR